MEFLNIEEQLIEEEKILSRGKDGMAVILKHLVSAADSMVAEYDKCDLSTSEGVAKAIRIQTYRDIVQREIPRMMENIMNIDRPAENRWGFWKWLKSR